MFLENGVHYPRVFLGAHPPTKKPEDSGYKICHNREEHIKNNQIASQPKSPTVTQLFGDVTSETCVTDTHIIFHDVLTFSVHAYTVVLHPCVVFAFIDVYKRKSDTVNIYMINLISRHYRNTGRLPIYNFTVACLVAWPLNENEALS